MIRYKKYKSNRKGAFNGKWYARAVVEETYGIEELAKHMASHGTPYSEGTISGVLTDMVDCIQELVLDGKAVKLPDLAIFSLGMNTTAADTADDWTIQNGLKRLKLAVRPTGELRTQYIEQKAKFKELTEYDGGSEEATETT